MNSKTNSILIVGSGLAGSTLAMELAQRGVHVVLIDNQFPQSSSRVAAGLLNPIVPKGVRKTWQCDTLFPALYDYYTHWEKALDVKFIHRYPFLNLHANANETHEWNKQRENASMANWLSKAAPDDFNQLPFEDATWVNHCGRLDVPTLLSAVQHHFFSQGQYFTEQFRHKELKKSNALWCYKEKEYDAVVFCEGIGVLENPWFQWLFFDPTGGDILTVHIPNLGATPRIIKQKQWIVPTGEPDIYLLGSNFHKNSLSHVPETSDAEALILRAQQITQQPVTLLSHQRAVRPTVQQRRPYLGEHQSEKGLFVYNGLGAKGSSLCSWLSPMLAEHILAGKPVNDEVDIARFNG